jgi:ABC-type sulfate transport system permease component
MNKLYFDVGAMKFVALLVGIISAMCIISTIMMMRVTEKHDEILKKIEMQEQVIRVLHAEQMMFLTDKKKFMEVIGK